MATQNNQVKQERTKSGKGLALKLIVLLIIVAAIGWLYTSYGGLPSSLLPVVISGKHLNGTTLQTIIFQKISSENQFAVKYNGSITISNDPPFGFVFVKFYNETNYQVMFNNLPGFGSPNIIYHTNSSIPSSNYICVSGSQLLESRLNNVYHMLGSPSDCFYTEFQQTDTSMVLNSFISIASLENINITSYGLGSHFGLPCYIASGTGNIEVNSTIIGSNESQYTPASMKFNSCFSSQYNIPLSFNATIRASNGAVVNVTANEFLLVHDNTRSLINYSS